MIDKLDNSKEGDINLDMTLEEEERLFRALPAKIKDWVQFEGRSGNPDMPSLYQLIEQKGEDGALAHLKEIQKQWSRHTYGDAYPT